MFVYLPPSYGRDPGRRYPVAYYLHGLYGSEADWLSKGNIDAAADSLFAHGTPESIHRYAGWRRWLVHDMGRTGPGIARAPIRCIASALAILRRARHGTMTTSRTTSSVRRRHYHTRRNRESRGIGGLSMGGYGAISLALRYPDVFGLAASHSGVCHRSTTVRIHSPSRFGMRRPPMVEEGDRVTVGSLSCVLGHRSRSVACSGPGPHRRTGATPRSSRADDVLRLWH